LFWLLLLIVPSDNVATSTLPDYGQKVVRPDETLNQSAAADEKKSGCGSVASATVELLRGVRDSPSAFGPLKYIAGSLGLILDNCQV